jgi:putative PIN family toxin of toxin-antitoxin system
MGKKEPLKVVLDTNVLISILLFGGKLEFIRQAWRSGKINLIFCKDTLEELLKVLHYPKFGLTEDEITYLVEIEIMPYATLIEKRINLRSSIVEDKDDIKFLECALSGKVDYLVSGDKALLNLKNFKGVEIITPSQLAEKLRDN